MSKAGLITGCSTGIGRDLAERLSESSYSVVATAMFHTIEKALNPNSPYRNLYRQSDQFAASMQRHQPGPEAVSRVIQQVIQTAKPKARYLVAIPLFGRLVLHLGDSFWDCALRRMFPSSPVEIHE